jgi:hypothetical protein
MTTLAQYAAITLAKIKSKQPDAVQSGTVQQPTPRASGGGPSDPTGGTAGTTPSPVSADMAVFEIAERRIDGTNIQAGDYQVIVWPTSIEITLDDLIICQQGTLTIAVLGREASGGETALYDMVCRG